MFQRAKNPGFGGPTAEYFLSSQSIVALSFVTSLGNETFKGLLCLQKHKFFTLRGAPFPISNIVQSICSDWRGCHSVFKSYFYGNLYVFLKFFGQIILLWLVTS